jgi:hypothetical protein
MKVALLCLLVTELSDAELYLIASGGASRMTWK